MYPMHHLAPTNESLSIQITSNEHENSRQKIIRLVTLKRILLSLKPFKTLPVNSMYEKVARAWREIASIVF